MFPRIFIVCFTLLASTISTLADDWQVTQLRGGVFALTNGQWEQLLRGSVVSDDRVIRSASDGRATFIRNKETVEVGPDTTAQISDIGGFTTIYNHAGTVGIDAEARNVKHLAVQTKMLAAVIKGTAFSVNADGSRSTVSVFRGTVEVSDNRSSERVNVEAGQEVSSTSTQIAAAANIVKIAPEPTSAPASTSSSSTPAAQTTTPSAPAAAPSPPKPSAPAPSQGGGGGGGNNDDDDDDGGGKDEDDDDGGDDDDD